MTHPVAMIGEKFGRLTVIARSEKRSNAGAIWECVCECGKVAHVVSLKLRNGNTKSCGCYRAENTPNTKHGLANKSPTYKTWKEMRQRCNNPRSTQWKWYGGKGIRVCERWDNYELFLQDMGDRPDGMTIDRINSDGHYEPSNCRWATPKQQAKTNRGLFKRNQTPHNKIPPERIAGIIQMRSDGFSLKEVSEMYGVHQSTVSTISSGLR